MNALTARQTACLAAVQNHIASRGYPPTLRELGKKLGINSTNGVNDHLRALERKGFIVRADMKSRGIVLTDKAAASRHKGGEMQKPNEWLWDPTPGLFVGRKRCLRPSCGAMTFASSCAVCSSGLLEIAP